MGKQRRAELWWNAGHDERKGEDYQSDCIRSDTYEE